MNTSMKTYEVCRPQVKALANSGDPQATPVYVGVMDMTQGQHSRLLCFFDHSTSVQTGTAIDTDCFITNHQGKDGTAMCHRWGVQTQKPKTSLQRQWP